jgi:hypothetical protein
MKNTITIKFLEAQVNRLNILTSSPLVPYVRTGERNVPQAGNYHLDGAYGGYALSRMCESGGTSDVFRCGHVSKRELSDRISAMICGIESMKPLN